jgi:hypothetical protein
MKDSTAGFDAEKINLVQDALVRGVRAVLSYLGKVNLNPES